MRRKPFVPPFALIAILLLSLPLSESSAQVMKLEMETWRDLLRHVKAELKQNYYDPSFRGIDIEARFKEADEKLKHAESSDPVLSHAASLVGVKLDPKQAGELFPVEWKR